MIKSWSPQATRHLFEMQLLQDRRDLSPALEKAAGRALEMARDTGPPQGIAEVPSTPTSTRATFASRGVARWLSFCGAPGNGVWRWRA